MEHQHDITQLLDLMIYPAFCVKDGKITYANRDALHCGICEDAPISKLIVTGQQEYADFQDGNLYLTIRIDDTCFGTSVSRFQDFDIFVLDQDVQQVQLQTMALAARELRTPLSNIMAVAEDLFPLQSQQDDPATQAQAARINRGLYQLLRIIGNMSDAYRYSIETEPRLEYRDICSVWDEFWAHNAELVSHADITLNYSGLRESIFCLADTEKLERAASNMLSNALKFTPKGSTIDVKLTRRGKMLYLTMQNSDNSTDEAQRGNFYSRYLRTPGIEDSRFGIGLGMVLIRSAATMHGGTVLMEHLKEQVTRITMSMQIRQDASSIVRSPVLRIDYAGERDHKLIELSEILPPELYTM